MKLVAAVLLVSWVLSAAQVAATHAPGDRPLKTTIKGLHTDFFDPGQIAGNETGWVSLPFDWRVIVGDDTAGDGPNGEPGHDTQTASAENCASLRDGVFVRHTGLGYNGATGVNECFRYYRYPSFDENGTPTTPYGLRNLDLLVKYYHEQGVRIVGIIKGVPRFAAMDCVASGGSTYDGRRIWCSPTVAADNASAVPGTMRLKVAARFFANRYKGRISGWVIMNEVNHAAWFNIGRSTMNGHSEEWLTRYAETFREAYDGIIDGFGDGGAPAGIPPPDVMVPLTGHFDRPWDDALVDGHGLSSASGTVQQMSVKTFIAGKTGLSGFASRVGDRKWKLAQHAYPRHMYKPHFDADDVTRPRQASEFYAEHFLAGSNPTGNKGVITHGTIGAVAGFLRAEFPGEPNKDKWRFHMTEGGIWSAPPAPGGTYSAGDRVNEGAQAAYLCDLFKNYLGTPGLDSLLYYRALDQPHIPQPPPPPPYAVGEYFGLVRYQGQLSTCIEPNGSQCTSGKPAWTTFALSNRYLGWASVAPGCGFEHLPYVRITRARAANAGHRISSRVLPGGMTPEFSLYLFREERPHTHMLYECWVETPNGGHTYASTSADCASDPPRSQPLNLGPMGYAYKPSVSPPADDGLQWARVYNCSLAGNDDILTGSDSCEVWGVPQATRTPLGWAAQTTSNFDNSNYMYLRSAYNAQTQLHWTSSVMHPPGFAQEHSKLLWIQREPTPHTKAYTLYYECQGQGHSFVSEAEDCGGRPGAKLLGVLGYILKNQDEPGTYPSTRIYYCERGDGGDAMISLTDDCGAWGTPAKVLGWSGSK